MQRTPVTSSNLASVGYDTSHRILAVGFRNGSVYQYYFDFNTGMIAASDYHITALGRLLVRYIEDTDADDYRATSD